MWDRGSVMVVRAGQFVPHLSRKCFRLHDVIYFVVWKKLRCFVSHTMYIDWQSKQFEDCSRSLITLHSHWLLLACVIHLGLCLEFSIVQMSGWDVAVDIRKVFQSESNIFYCWNCIAYARYLQCIQTKKYMQQASYFFMLWILVFSIWDFTELDMGVWE